MLCKPKYSKFLNKEGVSTFSCGTTPQLLCIAYICIRDIGLVLIPYIFVCFFFWFALPIADPQALDTPPDNSAGMV